MWHPYHVMNMANSIIGVSILSMPYCFRETGLILGICTVLLCGFITKKTCMFLIRSAIMVRRRSYEFLAFHVLGVSGKLLVEVCMIIYLVGICISFEVVIGDLAPTFVSRLINIENTPSLRLVLLVGISMLIILPLCLLRNLEHLSSMSACSVAFYIMLLILLLFHSIPKFLDSTWVSKVQLWRMEGFLQVMPIIFMTLTCQSNVYEIYESIPDPDIAKMREIVRSSVNLCCTLYIAVGFFGYVAFIDQDFGGNIILSLPASKISEGMQMIFVIALAISFPLMVFPCRTSIYSLVYRRNVHTTLDLMGTYIPELRFKTITVLILLISLVLGVLVPSIEFILGLLGSTMGTMISLILPSILFIRVSGKASFDRFLAQAILLLGVIVIVIGTYLSLSTTNREVVYATSETTVMAGMDIRMVHNLKYHPDQALEQRMDQEHQPVLPEPPKEDSQNLKIGIDETKLNQNLKGNGIKVEPDGDGNIMKVENKKIEELSENQKDVNQELEKRQQETEDKNEELEKKQEEILHRMEEQQKVQEKLLEQQKEILADLKLHHDKDERNEAKMESSIQQESIQVSVDRQVARELNGIDIALVPLSDTNSFHLKNVDTHISEAKAADSMNASADINGKIVSAESVNTENINDVIPIVLPGQETDAKSVSKISLANKRVAGFVHQNENPANVLNNSVKYAADFKNNINVQQDVLNQNKNNLNVFNPIKEAAETKLSPVKDSSPNQKFEQVHAIGNSVNQILENKNVIESKNDHEHKLKPMVSSNEKNVGIKENVVKNAIAENGKNVRNKENAGKKENVRYKENSDNTDNVFGSKKRINANSNKQKLKQNEIVQPSDGVEVHNLKPVSSMDLNNHDEERRRRRDTSGLELKLMPDSPVSSHLMSFPDVVLPNSLMQGIVNLETRNLLWAKVRRKKTRNGKRDQEYWDET